MNVNLARLRQFADIQGGGLERAIARSRNRAAVLGSQGFGLSRTNPSAIEAKIRYWSGEKSKAPRAKLGDLVIPDWRQISADIDEMSRVVAEAALQALDDHFGAQAVRALEEWPVLTGLSRALLAYTIDVTPTAIIARIKSGAPYTPYIREPVVMTAMGVVRDASTVIVDRTGKKRSKNRLPRWKAAYLVKDAAGNWTFDEAAYEAGKGRRAPPNPDRKVAKGKPYQDLINRPARAVARAVGKQTVEKAAKEGP